MKKFLLLGIVLLLVGCDKEKKNEKWAADAMISLRAAQPNRARAEGHLSALEIVQKTELMRWRSSEEFGGGERGFADSQRDFENERLLMWGTDIIHPDGYYVPDFIEGLDMVLVMAKAENDARGDTIAYIPNGVLRAAKEIIKPAFEQEDYATCYKVFDEAFTFIPITGAEWRALKAAGNN